MEAGNVKFFLTNTDKLFGFLVDENGKDVFFHYSNGRSATVVGPGEVKLVAPTHPLRYPKTGDYISFERSNNGKGPMARPWCFEQDYQKAVASSKRVLTLDEARQFLADKLCDVFEYTSSSNALGSSHTSVITEVSWLMPNGNCAARGQFVNVKYTYGEPKNKARIEVFTLGQKQYTSSTVFTGETVATFKDKLNIRNIQNGVKAGILWNGGWDDYVVDVASVRNMTAEELDRTHSFLPTVGQGWLKCSFTKQFGNSNQVVRIIRHLGGGD